MNPDPRTGLTRPEPAARSRAGDAVRAAESALWVNQCREELRQARLTLRWAEHPWRRDDPRVLQECLRRVAEHLRWAEECLARATARGPARERTEDSR